MTARRAFIRTLDRPGGRWVLSALATWYARKKTGRDIAVWYDDLWIRSLKPQIHVADTPSFEYFANDLLTFPALTQRIFEAPRDYWFYSYTPSSGDLIVDVGAGVGFDALLFSHAVGASGRVIAIEAHPKTFRSLQKFCELNQLTNTTCLQLAVVDRERDVYIEDLATHEANTAQLEPTAETVFKVQGVSIDEICKRQRVERIDLLKMNIEGAERVAIEGMTEMITRTRYVCIACHDFRSDESQTFSTRDGVTDFLRRNHFRVTTRANDARSYVRDHVHGVNTRLL